MRPAALAGSLLLAGCSISPPMFGSDDGPATTGSIAAPVTVQEPLPPTLAFSDAARIGQAAAAALSQAEGSADAEWVNSATGSSGTLEPLPAGDGKAGCGAFSTLVTSIGGVHQYTGKICHGENGGPPVVEIDAAEGGG